MVPTFNINVDPKQAVIAAAAVCAAGAFFLLGYMTAKQPVDVVCKRYIEGERVATSQVKDLEKDLASAKSLYTVECIKREKDLCSKVVRETTENIKRLRCRICDTAGVR